MEQSLLETTRWRINPRTHYHTATSSATRDRQCWPSARDDEAKTARRGGKLDRQTEEIHGYEHSTHHHRARASPRWRGLFLQTSLTLGCRGPCASGRLGISASGFLNERSSDGGTRPLQRLFQRANDPDTTLSHAPSGLIRLPPMKSKLIVNPIAGADAGANLLEVMNERLRAHTGSLDIVITVSEHDATDAARQAVEDGYEQLFVAGGDGTLNEALNGVAGVEGGLDAVSFGLIPLGTGNDFATALGFPEDVEAAIASLFAGEPFRVDVGRVNERFFVNVSAGGFIADVSDAVNPRLKTLTGKLAYLIGGAQVLLDYTPVRARVSRWQGGTTAGVSSGSPSLPEDLRSGVDVHAFAVCNSRLVGGGRLIAPDALVDDGELDVCLIRAMPTVEFVGLLKSVARGDHLDDERVSYFRARELELTFDRPIRINTDGQVLETDRCVYGVLPGAARFLGGKGAARGVMR